MRLTKTQALIYIPTRPIQKLKFLMYFFDKYMIPLDIFKPFSIPRNCFKYQVFAGPKEIEENKIGGAHYFGLELSIEEARSIVAEPRCGVIPYLNDIPNPKRAVLTFDRRALFPLTEEDVVHNSHRSTENYVRGRN